MRDSITLIRLAFCLFITYYYNILFRLLQIRILNSVMMSTLVNHIYTGVARLIIFVVDATAIDWVLAPEISVVNVSLEESVK